MALGALGTNAVSSLSSLVMGGASAVAADAALLNAAILNDKVNGNPRWPGAFAQSGVLFVPNRGILQVLPGDVIGVDASGWPILVSAHAIAYGSTSWTLA